MMVLVAVGATSERGLQRSILDQAYSLSLPADAQQETGAPVRSSALHLYSESGGLTMGNGGQRILVIGRPSPLLEGVSDLLQLAGYEVGLAATWPQASYASSADLPDLVIVDLFASFSDAIHLCWQIHSQPESAHVPILLMSFAGDDRLSELQHDPCNNGRMGFYIHTLLGLSGLLDKVRECLAEPAPAHQHWA